LRLLFYVPIFLMLISADKLTAIEKGQDKYRKTTMKLFHSHNEYVLHVAESQLLQEQYRQVKPGNINLLSHVPTV